ncbi:MAG TPA: UDP-N-acetylglucosamine 2-epimerase (non-hydrolyzing) [Thermoanaerobaculia bacterium]|jgi:UDP-N-acetylglucosamine 2-epimerase (non-hydrolysing)|nr:UDP-N-acetylglucosamine 2-epimerase (non-hydrolyzing) [Thermoanaerobaculia bacterium]
MHVLHVIGARPNFMKVAPVHAALAARDAVQTLIHTGQHYDEKMSDVFFDELRLPRPDMNLNVGSATHAVQTAEVMIRLEPVLLERKPDWLLVYGDVNSTMAATLVCAKLDIRVAHVEAGLRSRDRTMPEEINRLVTDQLADLLLTPSEDGSQNLVLEGIGAERVQMVGNVMIDTLVRLLPDARTRWDSLRVQMNLDRFALVTLHRPSNVDESAKLVPLLCALAEISRSLPVVFPIHPRTRDSIRRAGLTFPDSMIVVDPLGYLDFLALQQRATVVITDSGGVQEETTYLGIPCLTMRANTERPVTVTMGTNTLIGEDLALLREEVAAVLAGRGKRGTIPPLWDGHAAERVADAVIAR